MLAILCVLGVALFAVGGQQATAPTLAAADYDGPSATNRPVKPALGSGVGVIPEAEQKHQERENILAALRQTKWRVYGQHGAAALLGLKPSTLASRIKKMGLTRPN